LARSAKSDRHLHGVLKTRCRGVTAPVAAEEEEEEEGGGGGGGGGSGGGSGDGGGSGAGGAVGTLDAAARGAAADGGGAAAAGATVSDADAGADEPASIQPSSSTSPFKRMIPTAMATSEAAARVVTTPSSMVRRARSDAVSDTSLSASHSLFGRLHVSAIHSAHAHAPSLLLCLLALQHLIALAIDESERRDDTRAR
jgi:hypothetical protein